MKKVLIFVVVATVLAIVTYNVINKKPASDNYATLKEGVHYDVLDSPLTIPENSGVTITEFFWLGCSHCQEFEAHVAEWDKKLNKISPTRFIKIAVPGSDRWTMDARVFYTAKKLGASNEQITKLLGLYEHERVANKKFPSEADFSRYFSEIGVNSNEAMAIFNNKDELKTELAFADKEFEKINASGVPSFVVNGKYKVRFDTLTNIVDVYPLLTALSKLK